MLRTTAPICVLTALLIISGTGCQKNSDEAVVFTKEHIAAALPNPEPPNSESAQSPDPQLRPMADDQIAVDGYVMKSEERGTSRDPRALKYEQWIVKVRLLNSGRTLQVPVDRAKWETLEANDRVKVHYRTGRYTRTIWAAEIE
jgi:hypothetical protein